MSTGKKKLIGLVILSVLIMSALVAGFLWFKPHRNVQSTKADAELKVQDLVKEFADNSTKANAKYLSSDGNSKILIVEGHVFKISKNQNGDAVIILKEEGAKAGVNASFTAETTPNTTSVKVGDLIKIKGAITAGSNYNADLDLYEHAVLIQCDIVKN